MAHIGQKIAFCPVGRLCADRQFPGQLRLLLEVTVQALSLFSGGTGLAHHIKQCQPVFLELLQMSLPLGLDILQLGNVHIGLQQTRPSLIFEAPDRFEYGTVTAIRPRQHFFLIYQRPAQIGYGTLTFQGCGKAAMADFSKQLVGGTPQNCGGSRVCVEQPVRVRIQNHYSCGE